MTPEPIQKLSRRGIAVEIVAFVGFALLAKYGLSLLFWRYAGPVSLLLTLYMRFCGLSWSAMGLIPLPGWRAKLMVLPKAGLTLLAFAIVVALVTIVGPAIGLAFLAKESAGVADRWGAVAGSLPHFLLWIGIVWSAAAFGEEMFFRGYLITRLQALFPAGRVGAAMAVLLSALIFGYGHFYY